MDIYCKHCGEPWDNDTIHEMVSEENPNEPWMVDGKHDQEMYEPYYKALKDKFFKEGCSALGSRCSGEIPAGKSDAFHEMYMLFGDDLDGIADDLEYIDRNF